MSGILKLRDVIMKMSAECFIHNMEVSERLDSEKREEFKNVFEMFDYLNQE